MPGPLVTDISPYSYPKTTLQDNHNPGPKFGLTGPNIGESASQTKITDK
jgi:hypothetical protein